MIKIRFGDEQNTHTHTHTHTHTGDEQKNTHTGDEQKNTHKNKTQTFSIYYALESRGRLRSDRLRSSRQTAIWKFANKHSSTL